MVVFSPSLWGKHIYVLAGRLRVCTAGFMSPGLTTASTAPDQSSPILLDSLLLLFLPGNLFWAKTVALTTQTVSGYGSYLWATSAPHPFSS